MESITKTVPDDQKYHHLIYGNLLAAKLSEMSKNVEPEKKYGLMKKLHDSFKTILSCSACDTILRENNLAFSCGHKFCGLCLKKSTSCLKCSNDGSNVSSRIKDFSVILDDINELNSKFNAESIFTGLIRFLVHPPSLKFEEKTNMEKCESAFSTPKLPTEEKSAKLTVQKYTSTSKRIKTLSNQSFNNKRKLEFIKDLKYPINTRPLGSDSDSLFVEGFNKNSRPRSERKLRSYLENQDSVNLSSNIENDHSKNNKNSKRRFSTDDAMKKRNDRDMDAISSAKKRKVKEKPEEFNLDENGNTETLKIGGLKQKRILEVINVNSILGNSSKTLKSTHITSESESKEILRASGYSPEGMFLGFQPSQSIKSFNNFNTLRQYYKSLCNQLTDLSSQGSLFEFCTANVVDLGSSCTKTKEISESIKNEPLSRRKKQKDDIDGNEDSSTEKKISGDHSKKDIDERKITREVLNSSNHPIESCKETGMKKSETNVKMAEKKNMDFSISDSEIEDIGDDRWCSGDRAKRKKKSLFKSVKERNKKNVLLKLLEQKSKGKESDAGIAVINLLFESSEETENKIRTNNVIVDLKPECSVVSVENTSSHKEAAEVLKNGKFHEIPVIDICSSNEYSDVVIPVAADVKTENVEKLLNISSKETYSISKNLINETTEPKSEKSEEVKCSPIDSDNSLLCGDISILNTSTPISSKRQLFDISMPKIETDIIVPKPIYDNEVTILNNPEIDTSLTKKAEFDVKRKCANLKRVINDQNQKSFEDLMKNFGVLSPKALLIHKQKIERVQVAKENNRAVRFDHSHDDFKNKYGRTTISSSFAHVLNSSGEGTATNEILTVPKSPHLREIACQTTSDLHVALLKQEFPHLFQRSNDLCSVYNTPAESTSKNSDVSVLCAKTPISSRPVQFDEKLSRVSSVTTSEKKRCDLEFTDQSVIGDSCQTPTTVIRPENTPANVSSIVPLPSSDLKCANEPGTDDCNRRKLSVRLNFDEVQHSASVIQDTDADTTYYSSPKSNTSFNRSQCNSEVRENASKTKEPWFSQPVQERVSIEHEKPKALLVVASTEALQNDDVAIFSDDEQDVQSKKNESPAKSDDEDVDMIAGTPVSYAKRGWEGSEYEPNHDEEGRSNSVVNNTSIICNVSETGGSKILDIFPSQQTPNGRSIYLVTSGLKEHDLKVVNFFCIKFSSVLLNNLDNRSTHLIVKANEKNETCRTLKYLQAIVNGIRIVSINWLEECLHTGSLVDEESFIPKDSSGEQGPLRAFNVSRNLTPLPLSWLSDYCIYFQQPVPQGCSVTQLQQIVTKTGAVVVNSVKEMERYPNSHKIIIFGGEEDENTEILMDNILEYMKVYRAVVIEFNWLLEVIGRNRLIPFADYEFVEIPKEYLLELKFPLEMLQQDETQSVCS